MEIVKSGIEAVRAKYDAYNAGNREKVGEFYAPDIRLTVVPTNEVFEGPKAVLDTVFALRTTFPDMAVRIVDILEADNRVVSQVVATGTHQGELVTPFGTFPPTGKTVTLKFCEIYTFRNGKITSVVEYYDVFTIVSQLGLIPEPALATV